MSIHDISTNAVTGQVHGATTEIVALAIERSIAHTECVTVPIECVEELKRECEGDCYGADPNGEGTRVHEFWGTDLDGNRWCVCVYHE